MTTYTLHLAPEDVVRLVRAEIDAASGEPELYARAYQDYVIEEDYDRAARGLADGSQYDLVTSEATLDVEPRLEQNYWVLSVVVHKDLGPQIIADENALIGAEESLDAFDRQLSARGNGTVQVRLEAQTPDARRHFDRWWAELNARHPAPGKTRRGTRPARPSTATGRADGNAANAAGGDWSCPTREAVGVFPDPNALEAAVDQLQISGFSRAGISVLGTDEAVRARIGRLYRSVTEIENDTRAPRAAFVSTDSRIEGEAASVALPLYVGGFAGAAAIAAAGGALAASIAAALVGGAVGAGLGGLLAGALARHHAARVAEQLAQGGFVVWVAVPDRITEQRALEVLKQTGARDIHVHDVRLEWGPRQRPLGEAQMDPFLLERDPAPRN